ncbi:hypothetical protein [Companilactobacillus pabuli]|uniref:Glycosyltransferase RgtA/B/C/D-like domain-containing protein n=1 Tax=Companilactobacillus pabuli TaxID=2714036 RepID=A0A7L7KVF0_9LACO|nr:hypothetical protein [Companilactobacillus pabuli]QMT83282.1 hypothetical protein G6534_00815 [Companilactobacillus pabuli]
MKNFFESVFNKFSKWISPALLATILAALISGFILFVPPIHGLADNGDFYRSILSNGIYRLPTSYSQYSDYVIPKFGIMQYFNENNISVLSSQTIFIQLALFLNKLFYSKTIFTIQFMGLIYYLFYLGGIYLLTNAFVHPFRKIRNYFLSLLIVFIFADSAYTLYFNSFFAEPGMFVLMLYICASIISLARNVYAKRWPMITVFFVSTVLLITNKQQNAPLALSFSVVALGVMFLPHFKAKRLATALGIVIVLMAGIGIYKSIGSEIVGANTFQTFSHGTLLETGDPTKKIERGGVDGQFALMRNENYYSKDYATLDPSSPYVKKHLMEKTGFAWIIKYYATNLKQFNNLLDLAAKDITAVQPRAVGDFVRNSGHKPREQVKYFTLYSSLVGAFFPGKYAFDCLLAVGFIAVYSVGLYLDFKSDRYMGILRFFLILGLMTIVVFVPIVSIVGDGDADLAKHLFLIPISLNMALLIFVSDLINHTLWNTKGDKADV